VYHNPTVSAPGIDRRLIARLRDAFPQQVTGIKDSSGDWSYTQALLDEFSEFQVLVGDDQFLAAGLNAGASGAITFVGGLFPDLLRTVYDLHAQGKPTEEAQERLTTARQQVEDLPRIAATKWLLKSGKLITDDAVRPPLSPLTEGQIATLRQRFHLDAAPPPSINVADLARRP
jgi:4-hydroxy-tetrahydrodipicolinate synthase